MIKIKCEFLNESIRINIFPQIVKGKKYLEIFCKIDFDKEIDKIKIFASGICDYIYSKERPHRITNYEVYDMEEFCYKSNIFFRKINWKNIDVKLYFEIYLSDSKKIQTKVFEINYLSFDISKETWNESIYFIMIDRFVNSCVENIQNDDFFCGGTFVDVAAEIEEIKNNGYSIVYLSPIMNSLSYHGYDQVSLNTINTKFGGEKEFINLVGIIIDAGMKLGVEIVLNHISVFSELFKEGIKKKNNLFYIDSKYNYIMYRDVFNLAKLKYTYNNVLDTANTIISFLEKYQIGFIRLDCCDYLEPLLVNNISKWANENNVILTGECWENYNNFFAQYIIDGATNYWIYGKMKEMFIEKKISNEKFQDELTNNIFDNGFQRVGAMLNFIDNHDVERISNIVKDENEIKKLLSFIFMYPGIPVIYYGTENYDNQICIIKGNRRPYFRQKINKGIQNHIRYLNEIRKGFIDNIVHFDSTNIFFVFSRRTEKGQISFIYNNSNSEATFKSHYVQSFDYYILEE